MIKPGDKFGRLLVLTVFTSGRHRLATTLCDCGVQKDVRASSLTSGDTKSCGCLAKELAASRARTHGLSQHRLYPVWGDMKKRCHNSDRKDYKHYGGRGISICEDWLGETGLVTFIQDMFPSFEEGLEIERIDVNGNYCKENCTWATRQEQVINKRDFGSPWDTHYLSFEGKTMCISQWAAEKGIPKKTLADRVTKLGWSAEKALTQKPRPKRCIVVIEGVEYKYGDIFKNPPNLFPLAKRLEMTVQEYLAVLFYGVGVVKVQLFKVWEDVLPDDILHSADIFQHSLPMFKESFPHKEKFRCPHE